MDAKTNAAAREYKLLKEAFVSGLNGGTIWEINVVLLVVPICVLLWSSLQTRQRFFDPYTPFAFIVDFLLHAGGVLAATTIYSSHPTILNVSLLIPALLLMLVSKPLSASARSYSAKKPPKAAVVDQAKQTLDPFPLKPFINTYRGTLLVITFVCILAVDFRVFPRRFAKVETWGTSLMDIGVGSFVFAAGLVSARPLLKQNASNVHFTFTSRLWTAFRHSLPLFLLGLVRLYTVKGLDYAEHVTEYGVHWNFFFTLALLPPFVTVFDFIFRFVPSYSALALLLAIAYELALDLTDLGGFVLTAPRESLLSKNREGIFSFFGYLAIFLIGQATGLYILPRAKGAGLLDNPILKKLTIWSAIWLLLMYLSLSYRVGLNLHVSRRLANLPYVLWIASFNTCQLTIFAFIETIMFPNIYEARDRDEETKRCNFACSKLLRAFNRNGLALFLLANLLTGAANMALPTLNMSDLQAMGVLVVYMVILSGSALLLDFWELSIKL